MTAKGKAIIEKTVINNDSDHEVHEQCTGPFIFDRMNPINEQPDLQTHCMISTKPDSQTDRFHFRL